MPRSRSNKKLKPCSLCLQSTDIRYRVRYRDNEKWELVCPRCWQEISRDNPYYRYGGTWKAK